MAERRARRWLLPIVVSLLAGGLLSILSVPVAALVSQRWGGFSGSQHAPVVSTLVQLDDGGLYLLLERGSTKPGNTGPPRLLRHRVGLRLHPESPLAPTDSELGRLFNPTLNPPQPDTRPAFLRRPPPIEYTEVRCYSSGWPWHAGYSRDVRDPSGGPGYRRTRGEARITIGGKDSVLPYLPHWPGLLANAAFYASLVLVPWAGLRGVRGTLRRRRVRHGGCAGCGYPLDDGMQRCPECGAERPPANAGA